MKHTLLLSITVIGCLAALSVLTAQGLASRGSMQSSARRVNLAQSAIEELQSLDFRRPKTLGLGEPELGLSSMVSDSLMRAGLPVNCMTSLTPDADNTINDQLKRRGFRLNLQPVKLPDLGRFLNDWKVHHPQWRAISIQCSPLAIDSKQTIDRAHDVPAPLSVLIVFENVYISTPRAAAPPASVKESVPPNSAPLLR